MYEHPFYVKPQTLNRPHNLAVGIRIRVAACLIRDDQLLVVTHQKEGRRYHLLPGGGVRIGETLREALVREVVEETGLAIETGPALLICESIEPGAARHILNLVFAATLKGGELTPGKDGRLCDAGWYDRSTLGTLDFYPDIAAEIGNIWDRGFEGPVVDLGNVWKAS